MNTIASELETIITTYTPALKSLTEQELIHSSSPGKWTRKEMIGHLIDSAQNNIRRFIVAQYEKEPVIIYKQDEWVKINNYRDHAGSDLIQLLILLNRQIVMIMRNTTGDMAHRTCKTESVHDIKWLAKDYVKHLQHHL